MNFLKNVKAQDMNMMFMIIGAVVVILALLIIFVLAGKITHLGTAVVKGFS